MFGLQDNDPGQLLPVCRHNLESWESDRVSFLQVPDIPLTDVPQPTHLVPPRHRHPDVGPGCCHKATGEWSPHRDQWSGCRHISHPACLKKTNQTRETIDKWQWHQLSQLSSPFQPKTSQLRRIVYHDTKNVSKYYIYENTQTKKLILQVLGKSCDM